MESCIVCGTTGDGPVCSVHEEDVAFIFEGDSPEQLTEGRYYRGTVDGYADFGVFIDIGDSVTGLLHRNELDTRLESLDWEPGDTVFVQVLGVRDNGNIDLGTSIRQQARDFRGTLVDAPDGDYLADEDGSAVAEDEAKGDGSGRPVTTDTPAEPEASAGEATTDAPGGAGQVMAEADEATSAGEQAGTDVKTDEGMSTAEERTTDEASTPAVTTEDAASPTDTPSETEATEEQPTDIAIESVAEFEDDLVTIEGEVTDIRQTSGPTLFTVRDGSGIVECAAFAGAGERAYPDVEVGEYVELRGVVESRHDGLQIETEALEILTGDEANGVAETIEAAIEAEATPESVTYLTQDDPAAAYEESILAAATEIRRAIATGRSIVIRHPATADGYAAGAAIERAVLEKIRREHTREGVEFQRCERRPLDEPVYDIGAATDDVNSILGEEDQPLLVFAGLGTSGAAIEAVELLDVYAVDRIVIDDGEPAPGLGEAMDAVLSSHDGTVRSATALAATVGATVEPNVAADLTHLPAVAAPESTTLEYAEAAANVGYDTNTVARIHDALWLEAYYQAYNDKRELIADILFGESMDLVDHISDQARSKLEAAVETARENCTRQEAKGTTFVVLDADAFTHRFDFPPTTLLLDRLFAEEREDVAGPAVCIGVDEDELHVRATMDVDVGAVGEAVGEAVPSVDTVGGPDGFLTFLPGDRDAVLEKAISEIATTA